MFFATSGLLVVLEDEAVRSSLFVCRFFVLILKYVTFFERLIHCCFTAASLLAHRYLTATAKKGYFLVKILKIVHFLVCSPKPKISNRSARPKQLLRES